MSKKITIEIDEETAEWYQRNNAGTAPLQGEAKKIALACEKALAKQESKERARALHLPWGITKDWNGTALQRCWMVTMEVEGYVVPQNMIHKLTQPLVDLVAAAPELAAALEALAKVSGLHQEEPEQVNATSALMKSGWIK